MLKHILFTGKFCLSAYDVNLQDKKNCYFLYFRCYICGFVLLCFNMKCMAVLTAADFDYVYTSHLLTRNI